MNRIDVMKKYFSLVSMMDECNEEIFSIGEYYGCHEEVLLVGDHDAYNDVNIFDISG